MNILLKTYQETAVSRCLKHIDRSIEDWTEDGTASAIALSAFTSAGKTIIATALVERLRFGDGATLAPNPNLTVLWLTNSPSLNRQTMMKMEATSSKLSGDMLVEIDESVNGSSFTPGKVYFLNTQKLARGATSFKASESRPVSLEQMIRNTANHLGTDFLLLMDEAHVGTRKKEGGNDPLAYSLMNGDADGFGRFPIVVGISATPDRFLDGMKGSGRETKTHEVPVQDIREGGLIKKRLLAHVPTEGEYIESKMLKQAISAWQESDAAWAALHASDKQAYPLVAPLLLIQVEPGIDDDRIAYLLDELRAADPRLDGIAVAHSFGEKDDLHIGSTTVKYIAPEVIQPTTYVRAVLFKDALTTGWDCPRAEVLLSLRSAAEMTYVKQMIGRMVRTPLAMEIKTGDPLLNDAVMYLPHYDLDTIEQVRKDLAGADADTSVPTDMEVNPVTLVMDNKFIGVEDGEVLTSGGPRIVDRLRMIHSHPRPKRRRGPVPRLAELAQMLEVSKVLPKAQRSADRHLAAAMMEVYEANKDAIDAAALDEVAAKVSVVDLGDGLGTVKDVSAGKVVEQYTMDALPSSWAAQVKFDEAKRLCGAGTALDEVWSVIAGEDPTMARFNDPDALLEAQLITTRLAMQEGMRDLINDAATERFNSWVTKYGSKLDFAARVAYRDLMAAAGVSIPTQMPWPEVLKGQRDGVQILPDHVYVRREDGKYAAPKDLNKWESDTLAAMRDLSGFVGWWRNPTGGEHALGVRYTSTAGEERTLYPDFLGVYDTGDPAKPRLVLFDPHENAFDGQSRTKWLALGQYLRADYNLDADGDRIIDTAWAIVRTAADAPLLKVDLMNDEVMALLADPATDVVAHVFGSDHAQKM